MMYDYSKIDDFENDIESYYKLSTRVKPKVISDMMKNLYNRDDQKLSTAPNSYCVYALYEMNTILHKIGKATEQKYKMRHRMSLYGNFTESYINEKNYDNIQVKYVEVASIEEAWALERFCQGAAFARGEQMLFEDKTKN